MTRRGLLFLALLSSFELACQNSRHLPSKNFSLPPGTYSDGPEGLKALWQDILKACQKDERGRVHDLMASMVMGQDELAGLIGQQKSAVLWPRYQMLAGTLANVGAMELVAQILEKKYDDIAVVRIDELPPAEVQENDRAVLRALIRKVPLYTVRVKKKEEARGLRYEFFVYLDGRWRTGNLLGKYLDPGRMPEPPPVPTPKAPPAPAPEALPTPSPQAPPKTSAEVPAKKGG